MTRNFKIHEFECRCGCEMPSDLYINIVKLANQLQVLRDFINKPIKITNAYRCENHNEIVGGVKNSMHIFGKAADLQVKGMTPNDLYKKIDSLINDGEILQGGLGLYNTFVHYDFGYKGKKRRWNYSNK